jgi:mono/diheme cytochrome c family protein
MPQSEAGASVPAGRQLTVIVFCALLIAGCARSSEQAAPADTSVPTSRAPVAVAPDAALGNGKSIFLTGRDMQGVRITARPAPLMPSCAACHHADGSGGVHLAGGAVSADLRYRALVTAQKPPYTIALLERAISKGIDNTGQPLSPVMPRWQMSERDRHDVAQYVLTALK